VISPDRSAYRSLPLAPRFPGAGFTLIEVIVALAVLAIVVLGTTSLAVVVQDEFLKYTIRQKAIFALHSTMEQLVANYQSQSAATPTPYWAVDTERTATTGTDQVAHDELLETAKKPPNTPDRIRYIPLAGGTLLGTGNATRPGFSTMAIAEFNEQPWRTLLVDLGPTGPSVEDRALVWLDRERRLAASMSFTLETPDVTGTVSPGTSNPPDMPGQTLAPVGCGPTPRINGCGMLVLYLQFPYVLPSTTSNPTALVQLFTGYTETYTVATIVGPRLPLP
jgi:prepilin-type N-terminal cleavage/methylation domain-containing protein